MVSDLLSLHHQLYNIALPFCSASQSRKRQQLLVRLTAQQQSFLFFAFDLALEFQRS